MEKRRKEIRREVDRDRADILEVVKTDFDGLVRPLQDEIERQKAIRSCTAMYLRELLNSRKVDTTLPVRRHLQFAIELLEGKSDRKETRKDTRSRKKATPTS